MVPVPLHHQITLRGELASNRFTQRPVNDATSRSPVFDRLRPAKDRRAPVQFSARTDLDGPAFIGGQTGLVTGRPL